MRYGLWRVCAFLAIVFLLSGVSLAQSSLHINESAARVQLNEETTRVDLAIENTSRETVAAIVSLELVDPHGWVESHAKQEVSVRPGLTKVHLAMPPIFAQRNPIDRANLFWYRLRYSVTSALASGANQKSIHGVLSISETASDVFELHVAAPERVKAGSKAELRVRAVHPGTLRPVEGVTVQASIDLDTDDGQPLVTPATKTDRQGFAALKFVLPRDLDEDDTEEIDVKVMGKLGTFSEEAEGELYLNHFSSISLSTDKPLYQPGQVLHSRIMAFDPDHKAMAKQMVRFEINDPDDGLVFLANSQTSSFGVASVDWQIPDNLRLGDYGIRATLGEDTGSAPRAFAAVKISRYDLPTFSVGVKPDHVYYLPGQNAEIEVRADYLFGEPVRRGHVRVVQEAERHWNFREQKWEIKEASSAESDTNDQGRYTAHMDLSAEHDNLNGNDYQRFRDIPFAAYFTDASTGRTEQRRFDLRVTKEPIHIYLIPSGRFQPEGLPLEFYISTDYADGTPAPCDVEIRWSPADSRGNAVAGIVQQPLRKIRTNRYGVAKVTGLNVPSRVVAGDFALSFLAKDRKGLLGSHSESDWQEDRPGVRVETNKTLYALNGPIGIDLSASERDMMVVVDAVQDGQILASRLVHLRRGHADVLFPANDKFQNKVTIAAYGLGAKSDERFDGIAGAHTVYFPKNHKLSLDIHLSKIEYRPGEEASANIQVTGPDGDPRVSALGLVVVDKAIDERSRTDQDFAGDSTFLSFPRGWADDGELNGVRVSDLDKLDLSKPLPDGFEVTAEALLQMSGSYPDMFESDTQEGGLRKIFAPEIDSLIDPVEKALKERYQSVHAYPRTEAELKEELAESGVRFNGLVDPWETPFRAHFDTRNEMDYFELTSAGPDKQFGTEDDIPVLEMHWPYFKPYGEAIQRMIDEFHKSTGGYIRDVETLKNQLARLGVDLSSLKDRWNHDYAFEFGIQQTKYVLTVRSAGPDGRFDAKAAPSHDDFTLGSFGIDYFNEAVAKIDAALNQTFRKSHTFPQNAEELAKCLQDAGISWSSLKDPWGHPYYAKFRQGSVYTDRVSIETYEDHLARTAPHTETVPVTGQINYLDLRCAGEDGIEGTPDDFDVASFSRVMVEQSSQDQGRMPVANSLPPSGSTGAIEGTVTDEAGGVIAGAEVTALDPDSGFSSKATANDSGNYVLRNLPARIYEVRFESRGFRSTTITKVPVRSSSVTRLDVVLHVGETTQTITVTEAAPLVEMTSAMLNGRDFEAKARSLPLQAMTMTPRLREYFPETLLWQPELVTEGNGHTRLKIPLADNITTWKLSAIASTKNGEIGTAEKEILAFQPFFVEHDPPKFLTAGDEIDLPVVLRNYTDHSLRMTTDLKPEAWFSPLGPVSLNTTVAAGGNDTEIFKFKAASAVHSGKQRITAKAADVGDAIERSVTVRPDGKEQIETISQVFGDSASLDVRIPENAIPGSVEGTLKIYPNLNAHLLESIENIMGRPYGCAEQTISSAYPSLLLLEYAKDMRGVSPELVGRAKHYVQLGYGRLLSYQAADGGITYWGRGDSDPALTAYSLKFLGEASEFINVDDSIAQANLAWLVRHQTDDGRWAENAWGGQEDARRTVILTAYVARIIAATKVGVTDPKESARFSKTVPAAIAKALGYLEKQTASTDEPYLLASYLLASLSAGDKVHAAENLERLRKLEHREGNSSYWSLETNTPFYGWGLAGRIETTALVLQAFEKASESEAARDPLVSRGLLFLLRNQDRLGIWYSTQATVNVLDAIHSLTARKMTAGPDNSPKANQPASILVDGHEAISLNLPGPDELAAPVTSDLSKFMSPGLHHLEIRRGAGSGQASLQMVADSYVPWVRTSKDEDLQHQDKSSDALRLRVHYENPSSKIGEDIRCGVEAERIGFRGYGMMLAEIGLPPGAEVDRDSIEKAMKDSGWDINQYDVLPDRLVVYLWPHAGGTKFSFTFKLRFGVKALTPPSILYDYYNPEAQAVVEPVLFSIH